MKHAIHFVMLGAGGCVATGAILFVSGIITEKPMLKTVGSWFGVAAFAVASLPLLAVLVMSLVEKFRHK